MLGLATIVEFLAHPRARSPLPTSRVSIAGSHAPMQREQHASCCRSASTADAMSGYCSLQASRRPPSSERRDALGRAKRRRPDELEAREFLPPVGAEFRLHAALDEGRSPSAAPGLQLRQLVGVFGRQGVGNGRQHLRDLHQRAFQTPERLRQSGGALRIVDAAAEEACAGDTRRGGADMGADPQMPGGAGGKTIGFIGHGLVLSVLLPLQRCGVC